MLRWQKSFDPIRFDSIQCLSVLFCCVGNIFFRLFLFPTQWKWNFFDEITWNPVLNDWHDLLCDLQYFHLVPFVVHNFWIHWQLKKALWILFSSYFLKIKFPNSCVEFSNSRYIHKHSRRVGKRYYSKSDVDVDVDFNLKKNSKAIQVKASLKSNLLSHSTKNVSYRIKHSFHMYSAGEMIMPLSVYTFWNAIEL